MHFADMQDIDYLSYLTENRAGCAEMLGTPRLFSFCDPNNDYLDKLRFSSEVNFACKYSMTITTSADNGLKIESIK